MTPTEAVGLVDRLTRKLLLLAACLTVGFVASAVFVNKFHHFFFNHFTAGIPTLVILISPLAMYVLLQTILDSGVLFVRHFLGMLYLSHLRRRIAEEKDFMADYSRLVPRFNDLRRRFKEQAPSSKSVREILIGSRASLDRMQSTEARLVKRLKKLEIEQKAWYNKPIHSYLVILVLKFIWLLVIIANFVLGNNVWFCWALLSAFIFGNNAELFHNLLGMFKWMGFVLFGGGHRLNRAHRRLRKGYNQLVRNFDLIDGKSVQADRKFWVAAGNWIQESEPAFVLRAVLVVAGVLTLWGLAVAG